MKIVRGYQEFKETIAGSVLTVGNFDGVHSGHREIIDRLKKSAQTMSAPSIVYTFRPHPQAALNPEKAPELLLTYDEKAEVFERLGVDYLVEQPFSREFSTVSPDTFFCDVLLEKLGAKKIIVGYDFGFGKNRSGGLELLEDICDEYKIKLEVVPPLAVANEVCSSTRIRSYLLEGKVNKASMLLGDVFFYQGIVIRGDGRGKKIGFPTANIQYAEKISIKPGVYATLAQIDDKIFKSVTNFGFRPTVEEKKIKPFLETHLFDFSENLYGKKLKINFIDRIRDEEKFSSFEQLMTQIKKDIESAQLILNK